MTTIRAGGALSLLSFVVLLGCDDSPPKVSASDAGSTADAAIVLREDANEIPCAPRRVLQTICQQCHTRPTQNGAPFPLVNRSDILTTRSGVVVRLNMIQQLESGRMPLSPVTISDEDKATLLEWLKSSAPAVSPQECVFQGPDDGGLGDSGK